MAWRVIVLFYLVTSCFAQVKDLNEEKFPETDKRLVNRYLSCVCSPTSRGYNPSTNLPANPSNAASAFTQFQACVTSASYEDCINLDASRRPEGTGTVGTYCSYIRDASGRNFVPRADGFVRTVAKCDAIDNTKRDIPDDDPAGEDRVDQAPGTEGENGDGENTGTKGSGDQGSGESTTSSLPRRNAHEGCVAVEHLQGYALQHTPHLVRPVLCNDGFCATPNHAIIVNGKWTSMRKLCTDKWNCVRTVKKVNNLKWRKNSRAVVGDIIVTPYDLRFPRVGVVALQMIEDVYLLALSTVQFAIVAAVTVLVASRIA